MCVALLDNYTLLQNLSTCILADEMYSTIHVKWASDYSGLALTKLIHF